MALVWLLFLASLLILPSCFSAQCSDGGCFPPVGDLTIGRNVMTESQCSNTYCTPNNGMTVDCSSYTSTLINNDDAFTHWVSAVGSELELPQTIQIDLEDSMLFYSTEIVWQSPTPAAVVLERSTDFGETWIPYRYWADDCVESFGLNASITLDGFGGEEAICTQLQQNFLSGTKVTFDTSSHNPEDINSYRTITNIRLNVTSVTQSIFGDCSRYIAISDWTINGTCMCNGHADTCDMIDKESPFPGKIYSGCLCEHNTDGKHCEICKAGYGSTLWMPGTLSEANNCSLCLCNSHADDCQYDEGIMAAVCINCLHNTQGNTCSECITNYYKTNASVMDPSHCAACNCSIAGAINAGECDDYTGQCSCKANVQSTKCDTCSEGHFNLQESNPDGCEACNCAAGSLSVQCDEIGICECIGDDVLGDKCDMCQEGYYMLNSGCSKECQCNEFGSLNVSCDPIMGQCYCKDNIVGLLCSKAADGFYYRVLDDIKFEAEEAELSPMVSLALPVTVGEVQYTGRGYAVVPETGGSIIFTVEVPKSSQYKVLLRYEAESSVGDCEVSITSLSSVNISLDCVPSSPSTMVSTAVTVAPSPLMRYIDIISLCFDEMAEYNISVIYPTGVQWMIDSLILMPDVNAMSYYMSGGVVFQIQIDSCLPYSYPPPQFFDCEPILFDLSLEFYGEVYLCDTPSSVGVTSLVCDSHGGSYSCASEFIGPLCDQCQNGYYNYTEADGCQVCPLCNPVGSQHIACDAVSGECTCKVGYEGELCRECSAAYYNLTGECLACECSDFAVSETCDAVGQCTCPPNVTGSKCDQCQQGYYNLSYDGCISCNCNLRGSDSQNCDMVTGQCICVDQAMGLQCDTCPEGYYKTVGNHQDLCQQCFCFNHSQTCTGDHSSYNLEVVISNFTELCAAVSNNCNDGWQLLEDGEEMQFEFSDSDGLGYLLFDQNPSLVAPIKFLGDNHLSYGYNFEFSVELDKPFLQSNELFVSIIGSKLNQPLFYVFPEPIFIEQFHIFTIPMREENWNFGSVDGNPVSLSEFLAVLSDVTDLRLTAMFTANILEFVKVQYISLTHITAISNSSGESTNFTVESCSCSEADGVTGQFCDQCLPGYYRPSESPADNCIKCSCNNLAELCDITTGVCINCSNQTTGDNCEQCMAGYYGDPVNSVQCEACNCNVNGTETDTSCNNTDGTCYCKEGVTGPDCGSCMDGYYGDLANGVDCLPCPCTFVNSLSCYLHDDLPTCNCREGYTGRLCDTCDNGFFGDATNGSCSPCDCNGNVDPSQGTVCNATTGDCFNCLNNTQGSNCQDCLAGYFGTFCEACDCNINGTAENVCNSTDGTCYCKEGFTGSDCGSCGEGYYGDAFTGVCNDCTCNGNVDPELGPICDTTTGHCMNCLNNTMGVFCELCMAGFHADSRTNETCEPCTNCNINGTLDEICDRVTGDCLCREYIVGPDCDSCIIGYYGNPINGGDCLPCACPSVSNSHSATCHLEDDGQPICDSCEQGYTGSRCEVCDNGYSGDAQNGICIECDCNGNIDPSLGPSCNATTGLCLNCLNFTTGPQCEQCIIGYYGDVPNGIPCQKCACNIAGTEADICNSTDGTCYCLNNTEGSDCGQCKDGYWGLSQGLGCIECDCCSNGSMSDICDKNTGRCHCIYGVGDDINDTKCCQCTAGYYNFSDTGCQDCKCSNLSESIQCDETGQCPCLEAGRGLKCDECSFGYIREGTDCIRCHNCFFQWQLALQIIEANMTALVNRVDDVLLYYKDYSVQNILDAIANITGKLKSTMAVLSTTIDSTKIEDIQMILEEVNAEYENLTVEVTTLHSSLQDAEEILDNVAMFVSSETGSITTAKSEITALNNTIKNLTTQVNTSYDTLKQHQSDLLDIFTSFESFKSAAATDLNDANFAKMLSNMGLNALENATNFTSNLSAVGSVLKSAENEAAILMNNTYITEEETYKLQDALENLNSDLMALDVNLNNIKNMINTLLGSAATAKMKADTNMASVHTLMQATSQALSNAQSLASMIGLTQHEVYNASSQLSKGKDISTDILHISNPSVQNATNLIQAINSTIIPPTETEELMRDANNSATLAQNILQAAQVESERVSNLENIISDIEHDYTTTKSLVSDSEEKMIDSFSNLKCVEQDLDEINATLSNIPDLEAASDTLSNVGDIITSEFSTADLDKNISTLINSTNKITSLVTEAEKEFSNTTETIDSIKNETNALESSTQKAATTASQLVDTAEKQKANASAVALEELKQLLNDYKTKRAEVAAARAKMVKLQANLEELTKSFTDASEKYKKCYKTP